MPRPAQFRQVDVKRAVKAATAAGLTVGRIEIDPTTGRIVIETAAAIEAKPDTLATWRANRARQAG